MVVKIRVNSKVNCEVFVTTLYYSILLGFSLKVSAHLGKLMYVMLNTFAPYNWDGTCKENKDFRGFKDVLQNSASLLLLLFVDFFSL